MGIPGTGFGELLSIPETAHTRFESMASGFIRAADQILKQKISKRGVPVWADSGRKPNVD